MYLAVGDFEIISCLIQPWSQEFFYQHFHNPSHQLSLKDFNFHLAGPWSKIDPIKSSGGEGGLNIFFPN
jgi:hypothetical protein